MLLGYSLEAAWALFSIRSAITLDGSLNFLVRVRALENVISAEIDTLRPCEWTPGGIDAQDESLPPAKPQTRTHSKKEFVPVTIQIECR